MSITVKRNTGKLGVASKIKIELNGEEVDTIMHKNRVKVEVPEGKSNLKVTQLGSSSNEIQVSAGDIVEITATDYYIKSERLTLPVGFIVGMIILFVPTLTYRLIIAGIFILVMFVLERHFKLLNLRVVEK